MIAVVTGSSGFIGSHLVDALLAQGATVRAVLRPDSGDVLRNERVTYSTADLTDDRSVRACPAWSGATHVFHVAGVTKRRTLGQFREGNLVPTANILGALAADSRAIRRFVLVSSQTAAGPATAPDRPVRETDRPAPIEAYGRSKLEGEVAAEAYATSLPVTILRPGAVYGPRDADFLNVFREATHRIAFHAAPRDQVVSIVQVRDLVRAILLASVSPVAVGKTYFVAAEEPVSWRALYANIASVAGSSPVEFQIPGPILTLAGHAGSLFSLVTGRHVLVNANKVALSRPKWWLCDSSHIRDEIGWRAQIALQEGLRETYLWYLQAGWLSPPTGGGGARADQLEE